MIPMCQPCFAGGTIKSRSQMWRILSNSFHARKYQLILHIYEDFVPFFTCMGICCRFFVSEKKVTQVLHRCDTYKPFYIHTSESTQNVLSLTIRNDKFKVQQGYLWIELGSVAVFEGSLRIQLLRSLRIHLL